MIFGLIKAFLVSFSRSSSQKWFDFFCTFTFDILQPDVQLNKPPANHFRFPQARSHDDDDLGSVTICGVYHTVPGGITSGFMWGGFFLPLRHGDTFCFRSDVLHSMCFDFRVAGDNVTSAIFLRDALVRNASYTTTASLQRVRNTPAQRDVKKSATHERAERDFAWDPSADRLEL